MRIAILVVITVLVLIFLRFYLSLKKKYENPDHEVEQQKPKTEETLSISEEDIPVIESERILLRPLNSKDTKPLSVLMSNPKVVTPIGLPVIKKVSQLTPLMKEFSDTIGVYAIVLKSSGRLIGLLEMEPIDTNEVGLKFFLGKQFWRHGFGNAVLELIKNHLKEEDYKKVRAQIEINSENKAFLEQEGFVQENDFYILNLK